MRLKTGRDRGRADPMGLLILGVFLALTVTIGIQAQATLGDSAGVAAPGACQIPCVTAEMRR